MKGFLANTWKHRAHVVLALPVFLILFFIMYVPMTGLVMAFKNYQTTLGIEEDLRYDDEEYAALLRIVYYSRNVP